MPGVCAPDDANTIRAASASQSRLAMSLKRRSNRRVRSSLAHVASLCCISLIIKGLHLVWSGPLHSKPLKLFPFAVGQAFTCLGLLRELRQHGGHQGQLPWHSNHAFPRSYAGLESVLVRLPVAVFSLACRKSMPMPWSGCVLPMTPAERLTYAPAFEGHRRTCPTALSAFRLLNRVGEGDISTLRRG